LVWIRIRIGNGFSKQPGSETPFRFQIATITKKIRNSENELYRAGNLNDGNVGQETEDNDSPDNGLHSAVHVVFGVLQHSKYSCLG
jgi:hypothetical protein